VEALWTNRATDTGTPHRLDRAKSKFGGSYSDTQVEGVKLVTRLMPYLALVVPFWGIYSQMSTAFQNQGCQMNLKLSGADIPVSALSVFDTLSILMLVPVFDQFLYPYCKKMGYPLTMLQKIGECVRPRYCLLLYLTRICDTETNTGWGFVLAMMAMLVAAFVEMYRLDHAPTPGTPCLRCALCAAAILRAVG
jgi:Na+-driven multidrug efflux pump